MPFTLAHPAVLLPFRQSKWFSVTALVAGSMVPDFEFFFQLREVDNIGHHWQGIVLFDFPLALLCCYIFHLWLRDLLITNMPVYLKSRFISSLNFNWSAYSNSHKGAIVISLFIGILSHILWDGFTHSDGLFVERIPALAATISVSGINMPVYFLLQIVFSIAGLFSIMKTIISLPIQQPIETNRKKSKYYWLLFSGFGVILLLIRITGWPEYNSFWGLIMAIMGGICYAWLGVSVLFKFYLQKIIN